MDDIYDILLEEGFTPEDIERLMAAGVLSGEQQTIIPRQQQFATELRGSRMPEGRAYGGVYEEAHPLEFLSHGLERAGGFFGEWKAQQRQKEILEEQKAARQLLLQKLRTRQQQTPTFTGAPSPTRVPWNQSPVLSMQGGTWRP